MHTFIDFFLHVDKHLVELVAQYGVLIYVLLFLIIFAETGFVVTPFLPGDSLLFAAGALAAIGQMNVWLLYVLLLVAALLGNTVNYAVGYFFGNKILDKGLIKKDYLDKTQKYFDKYGNMTLVVSRFIPIVRTITPFVAGVGKMNYRNFGIYNIIGGFAWVTLFIWLGYFVGNFSFVKNNFSLITLSIIFISALPVGISILKGYLEHRNTPK